METTPTRFVERPFLALACLLSATCASPAPSAPAVAPRVDHASPAEGPPEGVQSNAVSLKFEAGKSGAYIFDTGILAGVLRGEGRSIGLVPVSYKPTGELIAAGEGLFNHYRVFTRGKRYGYGARRWPSTAHLTQDGQVEVLWPATADRPFELRALYTWSTPNTLDLVTTVRAEKRLEAFEVFLASYYPAAFTDSRVWSRDPRDGSGPKFVSADRELGEWLAFPKDGASAETINDGRWNLEPHPVEWSPMPKFDKPIAIRRGPRSGVTIVSMTRKEECFGIFTPHGKEKHYSNYWSTFGQSIEGSETARVRSRFVVLASPSDAKILEVANGFLGKP